MQATRCQVCLRHRVVSPAQAPCSRGVCAGASKHTAPLSSADPTFGGDRDHQCTLFGRFYIYANLLVRRREFNVLPDAPLAIVEVTRRGLPPSDRLKADWTVAEALDLPPRTSNNPPAQTSSSVRQMGFPFVSDSGPDYSEAHLLFPLTPLH